MTGLGEIMAARRPDLATLNAFGAPVGVEFLGPPIHPTPNFLDTTATIEAAEKRRSGHRPEHFV